MHRTRILASGIAAAIVVAAMTQGCSADSGGGGSSVGGTGTGGAAGSSGGSAGSTGGSAAGTGGSSGSTGGSGPSTGGSSGSTGGSTGSTGGSGGGGSTPCGSGISNGMTACTASCTGSVCGLADLGRRNCACTNSVYQCDSCAFPGNESILQPPTAPLDPCESPEATMKGSPCTENEARCQPTDVAHVCACWAGEWDCDDKPWE